MTSTKSNNRLLFLTVEYIEDNETKDYTRSDFRVSPLDPNMSSTARYSPSFQNSLLVPITVINSDKDTLSNDKNQNEESNNTSSNSSSSNNSSNIKNNKQTGETHDFTQFVNTNQEDLLNTDNAELIVLPGITGAEFPLDIINDDVDDVADRLDMDELLKISQDKNDNSINYNQQLINNSINDNDNINIKRPINNIDDEITFRINDEPVPSRARGTLPSSYLTINKLSNNCFGVFAKRNICYQTQFGPVEGILTDYNNKTFDNNLLLPLIYKNNDGKLLKLDVSNENTSNWMRFVRPALTYNEQNLLICQQKQGIIFITTRNILPNEELKAGPSLEIIRNLKILNNINNINDNDDDDNKKLLYNQYFETLQLFQLNLNININNNEKCDLIINSDNTNDIYENKEIYNCNYCKKVFSYQYNLKKHMLIHSNNKNQEEDCELEKNLHETMFNQKFKSTINGKQSKVCKASPSSNNNNSYKCSICYKRFASKIRLQQHSLVHGEDDKKPLACHKCLKRFMNNSALTCHLKSHCKDKQFECPICLKIFNQISMLKNHIDIHKNVNDGTFTCPNCSRVFNKYSVIRKHIRTYHCERKYQCQFCINKLFPTMDKLQMHLLKHTDCRMFNCDYCDKNFKRKDKVKEHIIRMHNINNNDKFLKKKHEDNHSDNIKNNTINKKFLSTVDYNNFLYKCHDCSIGFKRRGMFVNHLAKKHPQLSLDSIPELNLPILRQTRNYCCRYCDKIYKSSSKRKAHIIKNHPGATLLPYPTCVYTVGSISTAPQNCPWCFKQYATKAKLLQHQRKKHSTLMEQQIS